MGKSMHIPDSEGQPICRNKPHTKGNWVNPEEEGLDTGLLKTCGVCRTLAGKSQGAFKAGSRQFGFCSNSMKWECMNCGESPAKVGRAGVLVFCLDCIPKLFPKKSVKELPSIPDASYDYWIGEMKRTNRNRFLSQRHSI